MNTEIKVSSRFQAEFRRSTDRQAILRASVPVWRFLRISEPPVKSDAIFVFCSDRPVVADKAAQLYRDNYASKIVLTGGTGGRFSKGAKIPESVKLRKQTLRHGVNEADIAIEIKSTNTQENILHGIEALRQRGVSLSRLILVSLPYQQLRQWGTFEKYRRDKFNGMESIEVVNCPANWTLGELRDPRLFAVELDRMLIEIDNIIKYRNLHMIPVDIPNKVMSAYHTLRELQAKISHD